MPRDLRALIADAAAANTIPRGTSKTDDTETSEVNRGIGKFDNMEHRDANSSVVEQAEKEITSSNIEPRVLDKEDLLKALERSKKRNVATLGTPKVTRLQRLNIPLYLDFVFCVLY